MLVIKLDTYRVFKKIHRYANPVGHPKGVFSRPVKTPFGTHLMTKDNP